jgi:hypothetical protein
MNPEPYKVHFFAQHVSDEGRDMWGQILNRDLEPTAILVHWQMISGTRKAHVSELILGAERLDQLEHIGDLAAVNAWIEARLDAA